MTKTGLEPFFHEFYPIRPTPKERPRFTGGRAITPKKTKDFESNLAALMRASMKKSKHNPTAKAVRVFVIFYFKKPGSNKTAQHIQRPDATNLIKAVEDAGNGVLYIDDSQICTLAGKKIWADFNGIEIIAWEM